MLQLRMLEETTARAVPTFQLYEEVGHDNDLSTLHWESLSSRSGLHNWEIRAHRHSGLHQIFFIQRGGGEAMIDDSVRSFAAPCVIALPPLLVHGFRFDPGAEGHVITVADGLAAQLAGLFRTAELSALLGAPQVLDVSEGFARLTAAFDALAQEFRTPGALRTTALAASLGPVLIELARARLPDGDREGGEGAPSALFRAFAGLVERHAPDHWSVGDYAAALACTKARLTAACQRLAGRSPLQLTHDRLMLEAKRSLIYTAMSIGEIGYALGFRDAAYFCRFFARREGCPPSVFRERREARGG